MTPLNPPNLGPARRALLQHRIRLLVTATITYNVIEAAVPSPPAPLPPRQR